MKSCRHAPARQAKQLPDVDLKSLQSVQVFFDFGILDEITNMRVKYSNPDIPKPLLRPL
jgi:hypothetical protein